MFERFSENSFRDAMKAPRRVGHKKLGSAFDRLLIEQALSLQQYSGFFGSRFCRIHERHVMANGFTNYSFEQGVMRTSEHQRVNPGFAQRRKVLFRHEPRDL